MASGQGCPRCGRPLRDNYCAKCGLFSWRGRVDTDAPARPSDEASATIDQMAEFYPKGEPSLWILSETGELVDQVTKATDDVKETRELLAIR